MAGRKKARAGDPALVLVAGEKPQIRRADARNWTTTKEKEFLSALAETCNIRLAAEIAGVSVGHAYKKRKSDAAFRAGWLEAMSTAYSRLELVLLDRAFNGTEKVITRKDGSEERMLEYSNQLALTLLKMHRDSAVEAEVELSDDHLQEVRERLFNKLQRLRKRRAREAEAK